MRLEEAPVLVKDGTPYLRCRHPCREQAYLDNALPERVPATWIFSYEFSPFLLVLANTVTHYAPPFRAIFRLHFQLSDVDAYSPANAGGSPSNLDISGSSNLNGCPPPHYLSSAPTTSRDRMACYYFRGYLNSSF